MKKILKKTSLVLLVLFLCISLIPFTKTGIRAEEPADEEVIRVYGDNRYGTSVSAAETLKGLLGTEQFETVVLTTGENFADALAGSYLANKNDAPVLLINGKQKNRDLVVSYINKNLKEGGTLYLLGGTEAFPEAWLEGLDTSFTRKRLEGKNRYVTDINILKEIGFSGGDILVCVGKSFNDDGIDTAYADSLSASAVDLPILLVDKGGLKKEQKEYLSMIAGAGKDYVELEQRVRKAEAAYEKAQNAKNRGTLGFFEWHDSSDFAENVINYVLEEQDKEGGSIPDNQRTNLGAEGDATSLDCMGMTFDLIREGNELRKNDDNNDADCKTDLVITDYMMAISEVQCNGSTNVTGHRHWFNVGENLAWGYWWGPFDGWYHMEKAVYDYRAEHPEATDEEIMNATGAYTANSGHYENIVFYPYVCTGFAVNTNSEIYGICHEQSFQFITSGQKTYTVDEYEADFNEYLKKIEEDITVSKKELEDAQKALEEAKKVLDLTKISFHIIGGTNAVPQSVENELKQYGTVTDRLAGKNRYETSKLIAESFFKDASKAVLAYGDNFPDGLSGGPVAYHENAPLLLASPKRYTFAQEYCTEHQISHGYVLGGPILIPDEVKDMIFYKNGSVNR